MHPDQSQKSFLHIAEFCGICSDNQLEADGKMRSYPGTACEAG